MKHIISAALLLSAAFLLAQPVFACSVTDDIGNQVKLTHPAKRIVVLAPDLVEDLFAIGAGSRIVGVIKGSNFPRAAQSIQQVGSYAGIDLERIVTLHPDLIVAWKYAFPRQVTALKKLGMTVYVSAPKQLSDVPRLLKNLGCLTGLEDKATQVAKQFNQKIKTLHEKYASKKKIKVFYLIDEYSLITINRNSWINQVVELCGGKNIFADAHTISPEVSRESIITRNPDAIIYNGLNDDWKKSWREWSKVSAVKNNDLFTVQPDLIVRAGPRLADGAKEVCDYLGRARTR